MDLPKSSVTAAAIFAVISFVTLLIGVPLMLNDMAQLESELAQQRQIHLDMANTMWSTIMEQKEVTRKERATDYADRQRRQCNY
jgi:cell division protein FtsX